MSSQIDHLLTETRRFAPPAAFARGCGRDAGRSTTRPPPTARRSGPTRRATLHWHTPFTQVLDWSNPPFATWFADGELNVAYNCLDRHVEAGQRRPRRSAVGGRARRLASRHLRRAHRRGQAPRERAGGARHRRGRPRRDLHADDPGGDRRDARRRAPGRDPLRGLRRVLRRQPARPHRRRRREARHHGRRRLPQGQGRRRSSPPSTWRSPTATARARRRRWSTCSWCAAAGNDVEWTEGRDIWWHDVVPQASRRARGAGVPRREPAVHPLHVGHDRQAEGHHAHLGRLSHPGRVHEQGRARPASRDRCLLVHGRHRLGHRSLLRDVRSARERRDAGALRGHARHSAPRSLVGDHPEVRGDDPLHRADGHPLVHEARPRDPGAVRPVVAAAARLGR